MRFFRDDRDLLYSNSNLSKKLLFSLAFLHFYKPCCIVVQDVSFLLVR
jgi:hypothetical protein